MVDANTNLSVGGVVRMHLRNLRIFGKKTQIAGFKIEFGSLDRQLTFEL